MVFSKFSRFPSLSKHLRERDVIEENEAFEEKEALAFIILRTKQKNLYLSFEELNESKRKKKI